MTDAHIHCPLCAAQSPTRPYPDRHLLHEIDCPFCGKYGIDRILFSGAERDANPISERHLFAGFVREQNDFGSDRPLLTVHDIESVATTFPRSPAEKGEKLIVAIWRLVKFGDLAQLKFEEWLSRGYAETRSELVALLKILESCGFIENKTNARGSALVQITAEGFDEGRRIAGSKTPAIAASVPISNDPTISAKSDRITVDAPESPRQSFDVFLSHNRKDKAAVRELGTQLKQRSIEVWLDEWELIPGRTWHDALEEIITTCGSAAVCVAGNGMGPWEEPEMQALLRRFVNEKKRGNLLPVIPVLLPGAPSDAKLPLFLEGFTWVDLRSGMTKDALDRLEWGITGKKPAQLDHSRSVRLLSSPAIPVEEPLGSDEIELLFELGNPKNGGFVDMNIPDGRVARAQRKTAEALLGRGYLMNEYGNYWPTDEGKIQINDVWRDRALAVAVELQSVGAQVDSTDLSVRLDLDDRTLSIHLIALELLKFVELAHNPNSIRIHVTDRGIRHLRKLR